MLVLKDNMQINPKGFQFDPEESCLYSEESFHPELENTKL